MQKELSETQRWIIINAMQAGAASYLHIAGHFPEGSNESIQFIKQHDDTMALAAIIEESETITY